MKYSPRSFARTLALGCSLTALAVTTALFAPTDSSAQIESRSSLVSRMEKLERDIMLLQRQVSRGGGTTISRRGDEDEPVDLPASGAARLEVRIAELEEELRRISGKIEEVDFKNRQLEAKFDKMMADIDYRLGGGASPLGNSPLGSSPLGAAPTAVKPQTSPAAVQALEEETTEPVMDPNASPYESPTVGSLGQPSPAVEDSGGRRVFDNARDQYNYAFKLLNQAKYAEAAGYFDEFIQKYPKDPLTGNAYYWLGESYYVQRDYIKAADYYRQGFEAKPTGPKAADNLLKLSTSLNALGRNKEACVVLDQVMKKFGNSSTSIRDRADQERSRIDCR